MPSTKRLMPCKLPEQPAEKATVWTVPLLISKVISLAHVPDVENLYIIDSLRLLVSTYFTIDWEWMTRGGGQDLRGALANMEV